MNKSNEGLGGQLVGDGWVGEIMVSSDRHNTHVFATVSKAKDEKTALSAASYIRDIFGAGRELFIRVPPTAEYEECFDTGAKQWRAWVRFTLKMEPGTERITLPYEEAQAVSGFGVAT